jgi:hypothetical protein
VRVTTRFIDHAARYLAHLAREFPTDDAADTETLARMIEHNTGRAWSRPLPEGRAVLLDGRMLPHEWLETASGYVKTDALDHHDDHFFPGPQDIAWDVAAFGVEFGGGERLIERYSAESGDRDIAARVPFYRAAHLSFRYGYCDVAVQGLGGHPEAKRFRRARERYGAMIESEAWTTKANRLSA